MALILHKYYDDYCTNIKQILDNCNFLVKSIETHVYKMLNYSQYILYNTFWIRGTSCGRLFLTFGFLWQKLDVEENADFESGVYNTASHLLL